MQNLSKNRNENRNGASRAGKELDMVGLQNEKNDLNFFFFFFSQNFWWEDLLSGTIFGPHWGRSQMGDSRQGRFQSDEGELGKIVR